MRLRLRMELDVSTTSTAAAVSTGRPEPELIRYTARSGQSGRVSAGNAELWGIRPWMRALQPVGATTTSRVELLCGRRLAGRTRRMVRFVPRGLHLTSSAVRSDSVSYTHLTLP